MMMEPVSAIQQRWGNERCAVVIACRVCFGTATASDLRMFLENNQIDWEQFIKITRNQQVRPIVYNAMRGMTHLPVVETLEAEQKKIAIKNLSNLRLLMLIYASLQAADIQAIPYKGVVYSRSFYDDLALRESSDIDLLIRAAPDKLRELTYLMESFGYTPDFKPPARFEDYFLRHARELKFIKWDSGKRIRLVEFHTALNDRAFDTPTPLPLQELSESLPVMEIGGQYVNSLSPTAHVTAMIAHHGIGGQWENLKSLVDIGQSISRYGLVDWEFVSHLAERYQFRKTFHTGLALTEQLLGIRSPIALNEKTDTAPWKKNLMNRHLRPIDRTWRNNFALKLRSMDNTKQRLGLLTGHLRHTAVPTIADYTIAPLPRPLFFLYPVIKPLRKSLGGKNRGTDL